MVMGYCVKCKQKREMLKTTQSKTSRGMPMTKGTCSSCGTKMCRMGK